jgi:hypothetical protein
VVLCWLNHYDRNQKVTGSRPHGVKFFPAALRTGVYLAPNRNEYQKQKIIILWSRVWPVRDTVRLTDICEPSAYIM